MSHCFKRLNLKFWMICLLAFGGSNSLFAFDDQKEAQKNKAVDTYNEISKRFGNKDTLTQNLTSPLTSGSNFTTLDGKTSFQQRLSCPSSANYLELFFALGPGGDLTPVRIQQDTNFDGLYDSAYALPVPIAGVCANGIISCQAGTFDGCKSYLWTSDEDGHLGTQETELRNLAGCYCVNESCGSNLGFVNRNTILDDLGGGIAGALMRQDPRYAISAVEKMDFIIRLAGQDTAACRPDVTTAQHEYYDNPTNLSGDAFAASTSDSIFNNIKNIPSGEALSLQQNSCRIERQVTLDEVLGSDIITRVTSAPEYAENSCGGDDNCFEFLLGPGEDNVIRGPDSCFYETKELIWNVDHVERIREAVLIDAVYEDQIAVFINNRRVFNTGGFDGVNRPKDCQIDDQFSASINRNIKADLIEGRNTLKMVIAVRKKGSGRLRGRIRYEPGCDLVENVSDTCSSYAADDRCRLVDETVDGVRTFLNGGRTGLTPINQPRTLYGAQCVQSFSRPFFDRDRTYECEFDNSSAQAFDFNRATHIYNGSSLDQYADRQKNSDGSFTNITGAFSIDTDYGVSSCQNLCKTRSSVTDTEISSTGVVGSILKNPVATEFNYHQCSGDVCPIGPGETIVTDCGCLNEFPQALTIMQSFRLAGQDLICTSGTQQPIR